MIFLHGAFQTPWMWLTTVKRTNLHNYILVKYPQDSALISYSDILVLLEKLSSQKKVIIVGTSLGVFYSIELGNILASKYDVHLRLIGLPLQVSKFKFKYLHSLLKYLRFVKRLKLPAAINDKLWVDDSHARALKKIWDSKGLLVKKEVHSVSVALTKYDLLSGSVRGQQEWFEASLDSQKQFVKYNIFFSHHPYYFDRKRFLGWVFNG